MEPATVEPFLHCCQDRPQLYHVVLILGQINNYKGIPTGLWMIWVNSQVGKEERFTTGLGAAAVWLDRHEDPINLS